MFKMAQYIRLYTWVKMLPLLIFNLWSYLGHTLLRIASYIGVQTSTAVINFSFLIMKLSIIIGIAWTMILVCGFAINFILQGEYMLLDINNLLNLVIPPGIIAIGCVFVVLAAFTIYMISLYVDKVKWAYCYLQHNIAERSQWIEYIRNLTLTDQLKLFLAVILLFSCIALIIGGMIIIEFLRNGITVKITLAMASSMSLNYLLNTQYQKCRTKHGQAVVIFLIFCSIAATFIVLFI